MRKRTIITCAVLSAVGLLIASVVLAQMPGPDPDQLWRHITIDSPYTKWSFWPDHQGMQPGRAPHGPLHKVYVNDRALNSDRPPLQYGSIQVKENYSKAKELKAVTVMYKINGYNPKDGDWFWVKYSLDGKAAKFGMPKGCIGCHGTRVKNDFVLVHEFK